MLSNLIEGKEKKKKKKIEKCLGRNITPPSRLGVLTNCINNHVVRPLRIAVGVEKEFRVDEVLLGEIGRASCRERVFRAV